MIRAGLILVCAIVAIAAVDLRAGEPAPLEKMLSVHCVDCHHADAAEGELNLEPLIDGQLRGDARARLLERIHHRVAAKEMPPADSDTLSDASRRRLVNEMNVELDSLAEQLRDDPGDVAMARLTPYEFRNVIRDLSGGVVENAGRLLPNEGGAGEGFANVGAAQVMTLPQYEKYIDAAKDALRHLRVYPLGSHDAAVLWSPYPRNRIDDSASARQDVIDEIIAWHIAQQQK